MNNIDSVLLLLLTFAINLLTVLQMIIFIVVLMSWFPGAQRHPFVVTLARIAAPILRLAQKITPRIGMIDLSPIVALVAISLLTSLLIGIQASL